MTPRTHPAPWLAFGTAIVAFVAVVDALGRLARYAADPHRLWQSIPHDRNGHFGFGLDLALALRDLDIVEFFSHLERAKVWPPVHGLVLAATMLVGGIELNLAIVPSLIGRAATIILIWLICLRLLPDARSGALAGAIAVAFAVMSPAFGLITADVMLEGLGAALSCLCLYCYLRAREASEQKFWWRFLAIALTALFFEKFNYWLLTLVPLAVAFMLDEPSRVRSILARLRANIPALTGELRHPLNWAFVVLLAVVIAVAAHGPLTLRVFGANISLHPPGNLLTIAYALLFIRVALAWKQHRSAIEASIGPALQQLLYWHVLPVAASWLIPKRLAPFLWYIGPTHHHGIGYSPWRAATTHWDAFASGFHVAPWAAVLVMFGVVVSIAAIRRVGPALRAVALVALIGALVVMLHPQQQLRFQTTILPSIWILAGAGWAIAIRLLTARLPRLAAGALATIAVGALVAAQAGYPLTAKAYEAAIHPRSGPSDYLLFQAYRPYVEHAQRVGIIATGGSGAFYAWTVHESCKCRKPVLQPFLQGGMNRDQVRAVTAAWLERSNADTIVAIAERDWPAERFYLRQDAMPGQFDALAQHPRFEKIATLPAPTFAGEITIWRRQARP